MKFKQESTDNLTDLAQESTDTVQDPTDDSSIDDLADGLINNMSEVQEHVVNNHNETQNEIAAENGSARDKRGAMFDVEIHATEDDGSPRYTAAGYFAKKRGRGSSKAKSTLAGDAPINEGAKIAKAKQQAAGQAAANAIIMLGIVLGGEEWQPIYNEQHGIDEKSNMQSAFGDYFEQKGLDDIPAGIALSIAVFGYILPRFTMPKTQARSRNVFKNVKAWWINRKLKKHGIKATVTKDDKMEA